MLCAAAQPREATPNTASAIAHTVVSTSGDVPDAVVGTVRAAGYSDAQIVDTLLAIASITFTNLFNRVNATAIDFPRAA